MKSLLAWDKISLDTIRRAVADYPNQLKSGLADLDKLRYVTIPETLESRKEKVGASLTQKEATSLVEWKLKHGTFRPKLLSLVSSNAEDLIKSTTAKAYTQYDKKADKGPSEALDTLAKLKGIGPATASLLLSVYDPTAAPFFSDELFRWIGGAGLSSDDKPQGWDKKISYNKKEFIQLWDCVTLIRERLHSEPQDEEITAIELEKAAYVIRRWCAAGGDPGKDNTAKITGGKRSRDEDSAESLEDKPPRKSTRPM